MTVEDVIAFIRESVRLVTEWRALPTCERVNLPLSVFLRERLSETGGAWS